MTQKIKTRLSNTLIVLAVIVVAIALLWRLSGRYTANEAQILTSSYLTETVSTYKLSAAQFTYNGIAEVYKDDSNEKIKCRILYNAKVKAGIDMSEVTFEIDEENLTIKPILPDIEITSNLVDETSLSFIPSSTSIELDEAISACKQDAANEAKTSSKLMEIAEENIHSIIEGLLYSIVNAEGYTIIWD